MKSTFANSPLSIFSNSRSGLIGVTVGPRCDIYRIKKNPPVVTVEIHIKPIRQSTFADGQNSLPKAQPLACLASSRKEMSRKGAWSVPRKKRKGGLVRSETPYISGTSTTFGAKPTNRTANTRTIPRIFTKLQKSKKSNAVVKDPPRKGIRNGRLGDNRSNT